MRQLKLAVIAMFTLAVTNVNAQDADNPWVIGFGINTVDVRAYTEDFGINFEDLIGTEEWAGNTLPSISRLSVDRYLTKGFSVQLAGTINKLSTIQVLDDADALYFSIDAMFKYDLNNLFGETGWFDPYVGLGGSYQSVDVDNERNNWNSRQDGMLTGAFGFNTWFNQSLGLNFQTAYKHHFESSGYDVMQHSVGLVFRFGGKDTDGDGIYDDKDACPEVAGLKEFNGCPDADGDGIKDADDACPNVAGLAAMNGCPDTDGDGIADKDDMCPTVKGTKANKGCADTDRDGVVDKDDKCVTVPGPAANAGCPWPDTDKDGVLDKDDKCKTVVGPASNDGCPVPVKEVVSIKDAQGIDIAAKNILFNTSRSTFKSGVIAKLDAIMAIMNKYPSTSFMIEGHTDSSGKASSNLALSNRRANAVMNYFITNGVDASRLSAQGFGEDYPVDDNSTRAGRANNRRVIVRSIK